MADEPRKYEFTGETKACHGRTVRQIRAVVAIPAHGVEVGQLGGWVEAEINLDHSGDAWVYGNAQVSGDAWVSGDARVYGNARVYGDAWVFGEAWTLFIGGEYGRTCSIQFRNGECIATLGCFKGSPDDAALAIRSKYGDDSFYERALRLAEEECRAKWRAQGEKHLEKSEVA